MKHWDILSFIFKERSMNFLYPSQRTDPKVCKTLDICVSKTHRINSGRVINFSVWSWSLVFCILSMMIFERLISVYQWTIIRDSNASYCWINNWWMYFYGCWPFPSKRKTQSLLCSQQLCGYVFWLGTQA